MLFVGEPVERIPSYLSKEKTPLPVGIVINKVYTKILGKASNHFILFVYID